MCTDKYLEKYQQFDFLKKNLFNTEAITNASKNQNKPFVFLSKNNKDVGATILEKILSNSTFF